MCDEDARDEEANRFRALADGDQHRVTMDVTIRITVFALGCCHDTEDLENMVTGDVLAEGDIVCIREI